MGGLIPGLPDELVLENVVPRLPWHVRPRCRSISNSWKSLIDAHDPILVRNIIQFQLPLLKGRFIILPINDPGPILIQDEVNPSLWHSLPPLRRVISPLTTGRIIAWSGLVYVVYVKWYRKAFDKLDLGGDIWRWKHFPNYTPSHCYNVFAYKGNIYNTTSDRQALVYNMTTDTNQEIIEWSCRNVSVTQEEMYGFHDESDQPLKLMIYELNENYWRVLSEIPRLNSRLGMNYMVVNGDCFQPAVLEGVNIVTDVYNPKLQWYNSSQGDSWTAIDHRSMVEGAIDEVWADHGVLLCVSHAEERGFVLYKGTICVASKSVVWYQICEQAFNFNATIMT